jgi:alpha-glucosidase (family GH31 glycosyl hydrolase)
MPAYTQKAARNALRQKYSLSKFYYTKLYEISINGGPLIRPMFYDFPADTIAISKTPYMFMVGKEILVMPVLYKSNTLIWPYFPNWNWYDLRTRTKMVNYNPSSSTGTSLTIEAPYDYVNVAVKGGSIIPYQDAAYYSIKRLSELESKPMELIIALDHNSAAAGSLIVDEGTSLNPIENLNYRSYSFKYESKKLTVLVNNNNFSKQYAYEEVTKLVIMGIDKKYDACMTTQDSKTYKLTGVFDADKNLMIYTSSSSGVYWNKVSSITIDKTC